MNPNLLSTNIFVSKSVYSFSGNIIAFLAVDKYHPPFRNLDELLANENYILGIPGSTNWENIFKVKINTHSHMKCQRMLNIIFLNFRRM